MGDEPRYSAGLIVPAGGQEIGCHAFPVRREAVSSFFPGGFDVNRGNVTGSVREPEGTELNVQKTLDRYTRASLSSGGRLAASPAGGKVKKI